MSIMEKPLSGVDDDNDGDEWYDYDSGHHMRTSTDGDADIRQVLLTRALEGRDYVDVSK